MLGGERVHCLQKLQYLVTQNHTGRNLQYMTKDYEFLHHNLRFANSVQN